MPHSEDKKRDAKAVEVKDKYLTKKYFFGPNSPAGKEGQEKVFACLFLFGQYTPLEAVGFP